MWAGPKPSIPQPPDADMLWRKTSMKSEQLTFRPGFRLSIANSRSQAAVMVLAAGGKEGGSDNRHQGADQWLYVSEGTGVAIINGHRTPLKPGKIILIEAGDRHEVRNTGRSLLKTISVYLPPAYRDEDTELPAGRSS
jgi:mannose-6-phosphate isomerase-like protein (cupin superfamily)